MHYWGTEREEKTQHPAGTEPTTSIVLLCRHVLFCSATRLPLVLRNLIFIRASMTQKMSSNLEKSLTARPWSFQKKKNCCGEKAIAWNGNSDQPQFWAKSKFPKVFPRWRRKGFEEQPLPLPLLLLIHRVISRQGNAVKHGPNPINSLRKPLVHSSNELNLCTLS